jgi:hypothetical protein
MYKNGKFKYLKFKAIIKKGVQNKIRGAEPIPAKYRRMKKPNSVC